MLTKVFYKIFVTLFVFQAFLLVSCKQTQPRTAAQLDSENNTASWLTPGKSTQMLTSHPDDKLKSTPIPEKKAYTPMDGLSLQELLLAEMAYQQQDYQGALAQYYLLALRVNDPEVAKKAAKIAAYLGENDILSQMLEIWLGANPYDQQALMLGLSNSLSLGKLDTFESRFKMAMEESHQLNLLGLTQSLPVNIEVYEPLEVLLESLQTQYPQPQMLTVLAFVYEHQGKFEKSVQAAQKAIDQFDNPQVRLLLINNYNSLGLVDQSDALLKQSFEKYSSNRKMTQERIKLAWKNGEFELAYQLTRQIYERHPNDPNMAYQFGRLALKLKDYEQAKQVFNELLLYPSLEDEMNYSLGLIANEQELSLEAMRYFSKVKPSDYYQNAQYFRAKLIWQESKNEQEVMDVFDGLYANEPDNILSIAMLEADFWSTLLQPKIGVERLQSYIAAYPENTDLKYQYALMLDSAGDFEQSLVILQELLDVLPDNSSVLNAYGYVLGNRTDQIELALTYVKRSLDIEPEDAATLDSMGWLLYKLERYEASLPYLEQAFERYPHDEVAAHLGAVLWKLGQIEQAEIIWQKGMEMQPDGSIIPELKQRLEAGNNY